MESNRSLPAMPSRAGALPVLLAVALTSMLGLATAAAAEQVQAVQIRVNIATGDARTTAAVGQLTKITPPKSRTIAVQTSGVAGTNRFNVVILRATSDRPAAQLGKNDFMPIDTFTVDLGASATRKLADGVVIEVVVPKGAILESSGGDEAKPCTCCRTCSNGVEICGCRFQSSCGNCP